MFCGTCYLPHSHICMGFQDFFAYSGSFGEQNGGRGAAILTPNELILTFYCAAWNADAV